jgi:hypothetical protein
MSQYKKLYNYLNPQGPKNYGELSTKHFLTNLQFVWVDFLAS